MRAEQTVSPARGEDSGVEQAPFSPRDVLHRAHYGRRQLLVAAAAGLIAKVTEAEEWQGAVGHLPL